MANFNRYLIYALFLLSFFFIGCDRQDPTKRPGDSTSTGEDVEARRESNREPFENYEEKGDLDALKKRGIIRLVVLTSLEENRLPRNEVVTQEHFDLASKFAQKIELDPEWLLADSPEHALEMIENGSADLLADNITVTDRRLKKVTFSVPLLQSRQQLVASKRGPDISSLEELSDVTLVTPTQSTHVQAAKKIIAEHPNRNLKLEKVPWSIELDGLMDKISADKKLVAILDSNVVDGVLQYRNDIQSGTTVSGPEDIAWVLRKSAQKLQLSLNTFLNENIVKKSDRKTSNWKSIKQSRILRFLTYNGPESYFLWKGQLKGFDYDLARKFAENNGLQLQVIVAPHSVDLSEWLKAGRGDLAGAATTISEQRKREGMAFSAPYVEVKEQIVSNKNQPEIKTIADFKGRKITVRWHSSFQKTAEELKNKGADFSLEIAPAEFSREQILNMVAEGELDATIVDAYAAEIAASLHPELLPGMFLGDPIPQGMMALPENRELLEKLDAFIKEFRKSDDYKKALNFYFKPKDEFTRIVGAKVTPGGPLSPYDKLVKSAASKYDIDWRLITAQMWQESNFDPKAVSPVGAQGLLQVMPLTAKEMGYNPPLFDPERGINCGVKYLDWVSERFPSETPLDERVWFSLASYNAGYGHLLDARRLAKDLELDPDVWFGNVEKAMLKLSEPRYFEKARYGYVRGAEPVQYVRNISQLYKAYSDAVSGDLAGKSTVKPPLRMPVKLPEAE